MSVPTSLRRPARAMLLAAVMFLAAPASAFAQQGAGQPTTPAALRPGVSDTSPFRQLDLPTPNAFRSASGMPGPMYWQQKVSYDITASLDTATHTLRGAEKITYRNNSPDTLRFVWMQIDMNNGAPDNRFTVLAPPRRPEPGFQAGVTIERVEALPSATARMARPKPVPLTYRINSTMMQVTLDRPLPPHSQVELNIGWHHQIPRQGRTGRTQQGALGWLYQVAQWYPRLAVYDDVRGWNTDQYIGSGEFYLEYGDFDVAITMPTGFTVTATGILQNPAEVLPLVIRQRLAAAAHSDTIVRIIRPDEVNTPALLPPNAGATRTWRWHAANVRDFAWATAPNYLWDVSSWDGILMQAFYPPAQLATWRDAADMTRHAVMAHSERWFHYPYPSAVSAQGPVGGMEYPMMTFDDAETEQELYYTIAHEQGHEWYPMIVGSQERLYPWMDEGFDTFIDLFAFRARYPADTARVQSLEFGSMRAYQGFLRSYTGPEAPIMEPQDRASNGLLSGWNAYGKPAVGLHFLRNEVVDSTAFDLAFREYTRRWAFRHPMPADFFRSMNDALGEDLSWFWRSWFFRTDVLDQAVDSMTQVDNAGTTATSIFLSSRREMIAPVELRITGADSSVRTVRLPVETWLHGSTFRWRLVTPTSGKPVAVEIDPRQASPDMDRSNNAWPAPARP